MLALRLILVHYGPIGPIGMSEIGSRFVPCIAR